MVFIFRSKDFQTELNYFRDSQRRDSENFAKYAGELLSQPVDWRENRTLSLLCAAVIKRVNKNEVFFFFISKIASLLSNIFEKTFVF